MSGARSKGATGSEQVEERGGETRARTGIKRLSADGLSAGSLFALI